jgi:hypothetical protein
MPCPVMHTRATGEKEKSEFKTAGDKPSDGNYIKWCA